MRRRLLALLLMASCGHREVVPERKSWVLAHADNPTVIAAVSDERWIYTSWSAPTGSRLVRISRQRGLAETMHESSGDLVTSMALHDGILYFVEHDSILASVDGGEPRMLWRASGPEEEPLAALAVSDDSIYFGTIRGVRSVGLDGKREDGVVCSIPEADALVTVGSTVFAIDRVFHRIVTCSNSTGPDVLIDDPDPQCIVTDGESLFAETDRGIWRVDFGGRFHTPVPRLIARGSHYADLYLAGGYVFAWDRGELMRIPKDGGPAIPWRIKGEMPNIKVGGDFLAGFDRSGDLVAISPTETAN
jgi:hypothetical protein